MADDPDLVRVSIGARPVAGTRPVWREFAPLSYEIDLDMLELADVWSLRFAFDPVLWSWCAADSPVQIELNGRPLVVGFIDDRKRRIDKAGSFVDLTGRDKGGRLVDSAAPLVNLTGIGILDLARKMVTSVGSLDLFAEVTLQNATNRRLMAGGGRRARVSSEPAINLSPDKNDRRVRAGQTRAQVLETWLEEAGLLGWSSADGTQFVVGKPNYAQEPQFDLFVPAPNSPRRAEGNVRELEYGDSTGERYARIIVLGSGAGNATNYGDNVQRRGVALQGPNPDGTGGAFTAPKDLILVDDNLHSQAAAKTRAAREMALRESTATQLGVVVAGHSQTMGGSRHVRAGFAFDTMVRVEDEEARIAGEYLITRCQLSGGKMGRTTRLSLVPKGTDLRMTSA